MVTIELTRICKYVLSIFVFSIVFELAGAQINVNSSSLNSTLKELQRITEKLDDASNDIIPETTYRLAAEADRLALLMTKNVQEYGNSTRGLIELIVKRANDISVKIEWNQEKSRFFYDGAGYKKYLLLAPEGPFASECNYQLIESEFFRSSGKDLDLLQMTVKKKSTFLAQYPNDSRAAETRIMLAIEYRDMSRIYRSNYDINKAENFILNALNEIQIVIEESPATRESKTADSLRNRIVKEFQDLIEK